MKRYYRRDILGSGAALALGLNLSAPRAQGASMSPDLILLNGKFSTLDRAQPNPEAVAITDGKFSAVGDVFI